MRTGTAISFFVHIAAVAVWLLLAGVKPFDPMTAEAITVDIVPASEAPPLPKIEDAPPPETPKPELPKPTDKTSEPQAEQPQAQQPAPQKQQKAKPEKSQSASSSVAPPAPPQNQQQAALQQQPAIPPVQPPALMPYSDITQNFSKLVTGENSDFDSPAAASANISLDAAKALREHLKSCSVLPQSISPQDSVKIVMRVAFLRDGKLAKEPLLIEASASAKGPALMQSAIDALLACQPYSVLPADKYDEWKVLDLSFTPKDFRGR